MAEYTLATEFPEAANVPLDSSISQTPNYPLRRRRALQVGLFGGLPITVLGAYCLWQNSTDLPVIGLELFAIGISLILLALVALATTVHCRPYENEEQRDRLLQSKEAAEAVEAAEATDVPEEIFVV